MNTKKNKKNTKLKKTPYEISQNTSYFVKNRLPAFVLAGLIIFWTIASIFGIIGYSKSTKKASANGIITASAETSTDYRYIDISLTPFTGIEWVSEDLAICYDYKLSMSKQFLYFGGNAIWEGGAYSDLLVPYEEVGSNFFYRDYNSGDTIGDSVTILSEYEYPFTSEYDYFYCRSVDYNVNSYGTGFTFALTVNLGAKDYDAGTTAVDSFYISFEFADFNQIGEIYGCPFFGYEFDHTDTNLGSYDIDPYGEYATFLYESELNKKIADNNGFYIENAYNNGYFNGRQDGYANGYEVGLVAGANSANEYTFDGLLSAVFDVPVRTFVSLFDFDLLGVNLAGFFLSLLTLAFIIAVLRWIL